MREPTRYGAPMSNPFLWSLVLAIHLLCMAYWIGGGLYAAIVSRSTVALLEPAQRQNVQMQLIARYFRTLLHIIPTALVTGWLLVIHTGGFANMSLPINLMQGLALVMALIFVSAYLGPFQSLRRAIRPQPALFNKVRQRVIIMVGVGVLTVLCAAMGGNM
ncbi:hypothetical protein [Asaia bogorensis]|uniref:Copper resistance protein D domain-containing protein n=2 Tax=Asaia bogorensis TaxID=91915 RepID=A0AAN4R744_9PROT|nr:hypothetical protein [Asaia bogorensis]MDR6181714.1 putative membrane protein [Asaia bogorensis NBRC 16594]BAT19381.1 hypothetical protein Asbog_01099 [Asaia bogorensis NBRC 16594]GBQ82024.1 hypothetical protein AA0311_2767 [Asaia bogorensis NBRC 16594]GEL54124.1 hypothetical protein ABO01nite_21310 [Asaia bogorensis NBRC 16594]